VVLVEPAKLREFGEIGDVVEARVVVFVGDDPADVRPEETEESGRVDVVFLIGEAMMVPMVGCPPEDALLRRGHGHEGDNELEDAAGLEGTMGEIAVIARGHPEHAHGDEGDAGDQIGPAKRDEENSDGGQMNQGKRRCTDERDARAIRQRYR